MVDLMSTIPTYKRYTKKVLSYLGVYPFFDQIKANLLARKISKRNKEFIKEHPDFAIPSVSLAYDAYAHVDWRSYYENGIKDANWIGSLILKYCSSRPLTILDWGCGPARILRHIPSALHSQPVQLYGTDYNQKTIDWCQEQFPHIHFISNQLLPPLNLKDNFFDAIYGISVFTHLSKESHYKWIKELHRIVKPGGILILTTHRNSMRIINWS
jgi:SAM-dependent methyltransferase